MSAAGKREQRLPTGWRRLAAASIVALVCLSGGEPAAAQEDELQQARSLFGADRFDEARTVLEAIVTVRPDDGAAQLLLGRTLLVLGELDAAETALAAAGETPAGDDRFMVPHTRGLVELRRRRYAAAEERFDAAVALAPLYSGARIARAQARAFQGNVDGALADLQAVEDSPRPQPAARVLAGEILLAGDDMDGAFAAFRTVGDADGDTPAAENAAMYLGTMNPDLAETDARIRRGMGRVLARPQPYFWLAVVRVAAGENADARQLLEVALAIDELHAPSWLLLQRLPPASSTLDEVVGPPMPGLEYRMSTLRRALEDGDAGRVGVAAAEILARRPGFVPAHLLRAEAARREGQPLLMLAALGDLAEAAPWLVSVRAERAMLARELGALELATTEARRATAGLPDDGSLRFLLATILFAGGDAAGAAAEAEAAIERGYDLPEVRVLLGNAYQELQRLAESVAELTRAVEMDPSVAEDIAGFALSAMTAEDASKLVDLLETAREENPDGPNVLYALASLYQRQGEIDRAAELLERLLELVPGRSEIHYNLALAYRRLGRNEDAAAQTARFEALKVEEDQRFATANETYGRRVAAVQALAAGDAATAVELMRQVVDAVGAEPQDRLLLGSALMAAGQSRAASAAYELALQETPFDVSALCGAMAASRDLGEDVRRAELANRLAVLGATCPDS